MHEFEEKKLKKIAKFLLLNSIEDISISETSNNEIGYNSQLIISVKRPYGKETVILTLVNSEIKTTYTKA